MAYIWTLLTLCLHILACLAARDKTCRVPSLHMSSEGQADDTPAIQKAFADCAKDANIIFAEGVDYNLLKPIKATGLSNVGIHVLGNLHFPRNITAVQTIVNDTTAAANGTSLYWITLAGPSIDYIGTPNVTTGWIDSYGQAWWDSNPKNGTGAPARPHLMSFNTTNGSIQHYKSRKPIAWNVQLVGHNITVTNPVIEAVSNGSGTPFNTDGFGIQATNVTISDFVIFNGDDAFAIQSGAHDVHIHRGTMGYQSHGLSIGSLGQNQGQFANVSNIWFDDITVINAVYASRFKSWIGGQGLVKNITWSNIRLYNVSFPIFVTQTYYNQGSAQTQLSTGETQGRPNNSTVNMEDFTWANFTGTINTYNPGDGTCVTDPCWYDVGLPNLQHTEAIIVECNTAESCKNFRMSNIQVFPESMMPSTVICLNATAKLNPNLGFDCRNGTYVPYA